MASGDKFYLADKATLDEVKGKIGNTADTGGSSTTGSVFAKLNYLISQVSTYLSSVYSWVTKIGSATDTGGTATAGTVMAKENAVLIEVNKLGNTNDTGATATTGSLFAKVNSIFNKSCVKSVQRGMVTMDSSIKQVTISPVDMNKSFVLVSCTNTSIVNYLTIEVGIRAYLSSSTTIRFDTTAWGDRYTTGVTWQVIELN